MSAALRCIILYKCVSDTHTHTQHSMIIAHRWQFKPGYLSSLGKNKAPHVRGAQRKSWEAPESPDTETGVRTHSCDIHLDSCGIHSGQHHIPAPLTREDKILERQKLIQPKREKSFKPRGCAPDSNDFTPQAPFNHRVHLEEITPSD